MPKVSIILTSFNHAKYLRKAIDSVLNQSFRDWELIIWDDGSIDESWDIILEYNDHRIRPFRNAEQRRGIWGINKAITEVAKTELVAIHHSDDIWEPEKLAKQIVYLDQHPDVGAVFTHVEPVNEEGHPLTDKNHFYYKVFDQPNRSRWEWLRFFFTNGNALCHPSVLIRRRCYDECGLYRYGLAQLPDFDMWIRLCLKSDIYIIQEKLTKFRVRDSEANTSGSRLDSRLRVSYENHQLLLHYRKIDNFFDLCQIFPEASKFDRGVDSNIEFALAMITLDLKPFPSAILFALDILFDLILSPTLSEQLYRTYQFDYKQFIMLTGEQDPLMIQTVNCLNELVSDLENQITRLNEALFERTNWAERLEATLEERTDWAKRLEAALEERTSLAERLEATLEERAVLAKKLNKEVNALRHNLEEMTSIKEMMITSRSWRYTKPLRVMLRWYQKDHSNPVKKID